MLKKSQTYFLILGDLATFSRFFLFFFFLLQFVVVVYMQDFLLLSFGSLIHFLFFSFCFRCGVCEF